MSAIMAESSSRWTRSRGEGFPPGFNLVDAKDLAEWVRRIQIGTDPGPLLFDFARVWKTTVR